MPKYDDFDLNLKQTSSSNQKNPRVTSVIACTPGTCNNKCPNTNWLCSNVCVTKTCWTCA
ncbi:gallidermin/nisin family lantibiotic [Vagococcus lutrae]|uniref:gallidermin/nisin family lantibiotic n=1 Tax=Vagococcus lutrae TaxID=81947 RepID=UPI001C97C3D9|nr:gallidermin/nisin family lantibiotic [Vagococcus lutrae]